MVKKSNIPIILGIFAFSLDIIYLCFILFSGMIIPPIAWGAAATILGATLLNRFNLVDVSKLNRVIIATSAPIQGSNDCKKLIPKRYNENMPIGMVFCMAAGISIVFIPPAGVLLFLVAHVFHIRAFSGIMHLNPRCWFRSKLKPLSIGTVIFWSIAACVIFSFLVSNSTYPMHVTVVMAFFLLPYVFILALVTALTWIHCGYTNRPIKFRVMLAIGATLFLISDSIIGYTIFIATSQIIMFWIYITYFLAIFFMQFSLYNLDVV